ncbi:MAG TPA: HAD family hydrolase [Xanthobacteraceae bacterium]|nr:HAD family hydrolase [Xanthobacteraceae bacterium]
MNAVRAILFDKDGTLVDFDRTWGPATYAVMRRLAEGDEAAFDRLQQASHYDLDARRLLPTSPLLAGSSAEYGPLWADALGRASTASFLGEIDRLFVEEGMRFLTPIGTPAATLARLHRTGLTLGIATNDAVHNARLQVESLGLSPLLDAIYGYDSGHGAKPAPGMVLAFCARTGLPPDAVALVGDTHHDLLTAKAAGVRAVMVRSGPATVDGFAQDADLVVDDVAALADLLLGSAA